MTINMKRYLVLLGVASFMTAELAHANAATVKQTWSEFVSNNADAIAAGITIAGATIVYFYKKHQIENQIVKPPKWVNQAAVFGAAGLGNAFFNQPSCAQAPVRAKETNVVTIILEKRDLLRLIGRHVMAQKTASFESELESVLVATQEDEIQAEKNMDIGDEWLNHEQGLFGFDDSELNRLKNK